jgi:hypothetical protein
MTRDERVQALLMRGYFPKELPPPFTTSAFASGIANVEPPWAAHEAGLPERQRRSYPPPSSYARFDMARKGHSRRMLGVPNPVNQYYLTSAIADHQDEFEAISARSPISLTSAAISETGRRAVPMPKLSVLGEKQIEAYATARAILQTDVLSFYHAIYTHSVPWALHTKKLAKRNRNPTDPAFYGNQIDALLRGCQDGQTIGIPVGPDSSRIISELILCAIEKQVGAVHFDRLTGGYRYMDDFFLCFSSHVDAEAFLAALRDAVLGFDLQLNAAKTQIIDALSFNEDGGQVRYRNFDWVGAVRISAVISFAFSLRLFSYQNHFRMRASPRSPSANHHGPSSSGTTGTSTNPFCCAWRGRIPTAWTRLSRSSAPMPPRATQLVHVSTNSLSG